MSNKTVKLSSNDPAFLEKIYDDLKRERLDISKDNIPVEGAMGFDVVLNISPTDIIIILTYIKLCLIDGTCKVFLKNMMGEKKPIDKELLEDKDKIIDLVKEEGSEIYIEHKKR